jgi:hypothetical protein
MCRSAAPITSFWPWIEVLRAAPPLLRRPATSRDVRDAGDDVQDQLRRAQRLIGHHELSGIQHLDHRHVRAARQGPSGQANQG